MRGAGSMQLSGVRLSVRLSYRSSGRGAALAQSILPQPCCWIAGPQHDTQQQMWAVPCLQPRDEAEHRVIFCSVSVFIAALLAGVEDLYEFQPNRRQAERECTRRSRASSARTAARRMRSAAYCCRRSVVCLSVCLSFSVLARRMRNAAYCC